MKLSTKRIIILWVTVLVVVVLLGLDGVEEQRIGVTYRFTRLYGFKIAPAVEGRPSGIVMIGHYKYQLIVATLLIGLALFMTLKEK